MMPAQFRIDLFSEIRELLGSFEPVVLPGVMQELAGLSRAKGNDGAAARLGLALAEQCTIAEDNGSSLPVDEQVIAWAAENCGLVVTNDRRVRDALLAQGIGKYLLQTKVQFAVPQKNTESSCREVVLVRARQTIDRIGNAYPVFTPAPMDPAQLGAQAHMPVAFRVGPGLVVAIVQPRRLTAPCLRRLPTAVRNSIQNRTWCLRAPQHRECSVPSGFHGQVPAPRRNRPFAPR